jgi:hypothetical protein
MSFFQKKINPLNQKWTKIESNNLPSIQLPQISINKQMKPKTKPEYKFYFTEKIQMNLLKKMCIVSLIYICSYLFLKILINFDFLKL